jgi:colanic acid biosynthesis protein WcaH
MSVELCPEDFDKLRRWAPLVSIDLIVQDARGRVLLGFRNNEPAKETWFVPGGRIRKDEKLAEAFGRIVREELNAGNDLGVSVDVADARFAGVFEHHYPASDQMPVSVHYVVLAYRLTASKDDVSKLPHSQHAEWRWFETQGLRSDAKVHPNVQVYFTVPGTGSGPGSLAGCGWKSSR